MNRTVAYQETSNNFDDVRQQIKGSQISTIKNFGVAPPSGGGDFVGQFGLAADAQGNSLLYTYGIGGLWNLVGTSGNASLPDTVVQENLKNNFTEVDQRIEDCPITFMDSGTRVIDNVAIKGPGHIYIYESNPPKMFMSFDGQNWTQLQTEFDAADGDVKADKANNFTNPDQKIQGSAIANVRKGPNAPDPAVIVPSREGEFYIQIAEGTADRKARIWVANNAGGWKWEQLTHIYELPNTVAQTSKINDFQATEQTIAGKQIMSFVDGGSQTPEQSGIPADYDGQFYIAVHEFVAGTKEVAIWVAEGNQWLPLSKDISLGTIVRTDKSNRFAVAEQILGEGGGNARWLAGNRIKFSGASPIADGNWRVQNVGEVTIYENNTVVPRELSIWMGVSKNPSSDSNAGEWALVWSNKQGDVNDYARVDISNDFVPFQYINSGAKRHMINTGHEGGSGSPKKSLIPVAPGDTYTRSYSHPSYGTTREIWMAAIEGDTESWHRMLDENSKDVVFNDRENHFATRDQFLGLENDTKRNRIMGSRIHHTPNSVIYNGVIPRMTGECVINERYDENFPGDESKKIVEILMAVGTGRKSWIEIGRRLKSELDIIDDGSNN